MDRDEGDRQMTGAFSHVQCSHVLLTRSVDVDDAIVSDVNDHASCGSMFRYLNPYISTTA